MQTKTLQQTVTFKASPLEVYDMLMDSKKHRSLLGEPAKISKKVGGKFTAWDLIYPASISCSSQVRRSCRRGARQAGGRTTIPSQSSTSLKYVAARSSSLHRSASHPAATAAITVVGSRPIGRQ